MSKTDVAGSADSDVGRAEVCVYDKHEEDQAPALKALLLSEAQPCIRSRSCTLAIATAAFAIESRLGRLQVMQRDFRRAIEPNRDCG